MKSPPPSRTEWPDAEAARATTYARHLCAAEVVSLRRCSGGGNNRVYRVETGAGAFALKCYGPLEADGRDRLRHEFDGLRFLVACGSGDIVPKPLAVDRTNRCALYDWIEGAPVGPYGADDIAQLISLLMTLRRVSISRGASELPRAAEAVLGAIDLREQIVFRLRRLRAVTADHRELAQFVANDIEPELKRRLDRLGDQWNEELPRVRQTLSPSDLGFHNALRRPDGALTFIDFEYFGWDDPVKVSADVMLHPAMELPPEFRRQFLQGARELYGSDPNFPKRLAVYFPLFGIRWALIILNEFLPAVWKRREFAGTSDRRELVLAEQLGKARTMIERVRSYDEGEFF